MVQLSLPVYMLGLHNKRQALQSDNLRFKFQPCPLFVDDVEHGVNKNSVHGEYGEEGRWGGVSGSSCREDGSPPPCHGACSHHPLLILLEHDVEDVNGDAVEGIRVDRRLQEGQEGTDHGGDEDEEDKLGPGGKRLSCWGGWGGSLGRGLGRITWRSGGRGG